MDCQPEFDRLLNETKTMLDHHAVGSEGSDAPWIANLRLEWTRASRSYRDFKAEANEIVHLLPHSGPKRGLTNAGGSVLKTLFGTMDNDDLEYLNGSIGQMAKELDDAALRLTLLKDLSQDVTTNTQLIKQAVQGLHRELRNTLQVIRGQQRLWETQLQRITGYARISTALREVQQLLFGSQLRITQLREALELMATGRLSSSLLPPRHLLEVLRVVQDRVHPPAYMIAPCDQQHLHIYYETSIFIVRSHPPDSRTSSRKCLSNIFKILALAHGYPVPVPDV